MNGKRFSRQGVAKLPFSDEQRLLEEVEKLEHTLTEEEAQRSSVMSDMLFVSLSHTLSPYIFSLDDRYKQMTDEERITVTEQLDPGASGGMNGYISLCTGDPCPPLFRSPIQGMEDIMNNQVICAIYRLPGYHEHIPRPPPGVIVPKKIVTVGDLRPEPVLWHEDSGRRPFDNGRHNNNRHHNNSTNGSGHGRHLGDAAHRLVSNSLQLRQENNGQASQMHPPYSHYAVADAQHYQAYPHQMYPGADCNMVQANSSYNHDRPPGSVPYRQYLAPPMYSNPYDRSQNPPTEPNHRFDRSQNPATEPNYRSAAPPARDHSRHGYYAQGPPQHGYGYSSYPPRNASEAPIHPGVHYHQSGGYNRSEDGRSYGHSNYNNNSGGGGRSGDSYSDGGYNQHRGSSNQFSGLARGGGRRSPHLDYCR